MLKRPLTIGGMMVGVAEVAALLAFARVAPAMAAYAGLVLGLTWVRMYAPPRHVGGASLDEWLALACVTVLMAGLSMPWASGRSGRCTSFAPGALFKVAAATTAEVNASVTSPR